MGVIQNSVNQALGTAAAAATLGKHIQNQELEKETKLAENAAEFTRKGAAFKNDTIEAATAISAHEPTFSAKVGDKNFKDMSAEELNKMTDEQVEKLAIDVDAFRSGKMTQDRIDRMGKAGEELKAANALKDDYVEFKGGEAITKEDKIAEANKHLEKAYEASRELNARIDASRKLKFDIETARKNIATLKGGKK